MLEGTLRIALLALAVALLASVAQGEEPTGQAELQRRVASAVREGGVDGMAALPDVLVLRQGATLYGLDPYSLQQLWVYRGKELVAGPTLVGERLFVIQKEVRESSSGYGGGTTRITYHRILEIAPDSGLLRGWKEAASSTVRLLSTCGRAVFLLDRYIYTVSGEGPLSLVSLEKHLNLYLATRAFAPERVRLAGSHLLAWVPELRLAVSFDLERNAQAWRRGFPEEIVDVRGCGDVQTATTVGGKLLGLDARTGNTVWQSALPQERIVLLLQSGQPLSLSTGNLPGWIDPKDGTIRTLQEDDPESPRNLLEDGHGRALLSQGNRLTVHGSPSGTRDWLYDAGEPIRLLSAAESYVALVTETGRLDVLGQSRASATEAPPQSAGGIDLVVDPEDAFVWLDGSYLGPGGRPIETLSPGMHRLRLFHPDRKRLDIEAEVAPGRLTPLALTLERRSQGPIRIDSTPAGAVVLIDGENRGKTPLTLYQYPASQVLQVTVSRTGYRDVSQRLFVREDGAALSADLRFAPPTGGAFGIVGRTGTGAIRGWREADIREGRVEGEPYRPADGEVFVKAIASIEWGPSRWRLFARGGYSNHEHILFEGEGGFWFAVDQGLRVEVGASYLMLGLSHPSSEPPTRGESEDATPDRSAPLEQWRHPIPRVLVGNESPSYWLGKLRLRPRAGLLVELGAGILEGARLRGTALVQDAAGHLVRDPARSYDFQGRNGGIADARLQLALGTFRIWKLAPSTAVDIHYRHRWADFGPARESTGELTVGLGILYFDKRQGGL